MFVKETREMHLSVDELYEAMDAGERQHMANKLYKHGTIPSRAIKTPVTVEEAARFLSSFLGKSAMVSHLRDNYPQAHQRYQELFGPDPKSVEQMIVDNGVCMNDELSELCLNRIPPANIWAYAMANHSGFLQRAIENHQIR